MNVVEAIEARRAVRSFTARKIDDAAIRTLLRAAVQAPSAMNRQPWTFAIVQDPGTLRRYSDRAKEMLRTRTDPTASHYAELLGGPAFNIFYDAGTLVVIGVEEASTYAEADAWLAAENLLLAATDMGIGSCCIGFAVPVLNTEEVKAELGIGPKGAAIAPIILGYPSVVAPPVPRADPKIVAWLR